MFAPPWLLKRTPKIPGINVISPKNSSILASEIFATKLKSFCFKTSLANKSNKIRTIPIIIGEKTALVPKKLKLPPDSSLFSSMIEASKANSTKPGIGKIKNEAIAAIPNPDNLPGFEIILNI